MNDAAKKQALPVPSATSQDVLESLRNQLPAEIFARLEARAAVGKAKYGTTLMTADGRDNPLDAEQEALDGVMYAQKGFLQGEFNKSILHAFLALAIKIHDLRQQ